MSAKTRLFAMICRCFLSILYDLQVSPIHYPEQRLVFDEELVRIQFTIADIQHEVHQEEVLTSS